MIRCMGCMAEYGEGTEVCPHCGYVRGTPAREAYHLSPESILGGRYIVGRVLGFGGFGVTYIGWDAQLDRVVAIKEFLPTTFATRMPGGTAVTVYEGNATTQYGFGLERFVEEAQRLAQFNGIPGITDIYDTFSGNNTAYIVMQFLKGRDVKEVLSSEGPMPFEKARDIVLRVCDTLAPVHAKGVIHRDISPDNIYLTDEGEVKLLDFGAARYESSVNSKSLSVILKAGYAPEEQYRSRGDQGPWTDVYALAATFYKMLTGVTPPDSMERAVKDEIREPSKLGSDIPQSAENALMNALNIRKSDRTQSVEAFKAALQGGEVERVKVKAARAQTGRVPVPAIVGMALAGVLLVAFIVLSSTGVINMGGNVLEDTFGSPVAEGNALVPNLIGKTEAEAKKLVEDAGLLLEVGEPFYTLDTPKGAVMMQEPLAGRQLEAGGTVAVQVCAGSVADMMNENEAGLPAWQAEQMLMSIPGGLMADTGEGFRYTTVTYYEYSDTVPQGCVTRYEMVNEQRVQLWVSAGPNNATEEQGELRGVYLANSYNTWSGGYAAIEYAVAMPPHMKQEEDGPWLERGNMTFYLSADDGASWQPLAKHNGEPFVQSGGSRSGHSEEYEQQGTISWCSVTIGMQLAENHPELAGKPLRLRVDYHRQGAEDPETGETALGPVVQTVELEQTLTLEFTEEQMPTITGADILTWDDVKTMVENEELSEGNAVRWRYESIDFSEEEDAGESYTIYRLYGDFEAEKYYRLATYGYDIENGYYGGYDEDGTYGCTKDGELICLKYTGPRYVVGTGEYSSYELWLTQTYGDSRCTPDAAGNVTNTTILPRRTLVVYSQVRTDWDGTTPLGQIVDATPVPEGKGYD